MTRCQKYQNMYSRHCDCWWPGAKTPTVSTVIVGFASARRGGCNSEDFNKLRPKQNGCQFPDDIFKCIFWNENIWIPMEISLTFVPKGPINNIPSLVHIMAWCRPGDKPSSEPMMVSLLTHACVTRPQLVEMIPYWGLMLPYDVTEFWSALVQVIGFHLFGTKYVIIWTNPGLPPVGRNLSAYWIQIPRILPLVARGIKTLYLDKSPYLLKQTWVNQYYYMITCIPYPRQI